MVNLLKTLINFTAFLLLVQGAVIFSTPTFRITPADISHLPPLETGDWVLRAGTVTDSRIIMEVSHGNYSHIGMIVRVKPEILVVHATTDDGYVQRNQVFVSPLAEFLSPQLAKKALILRPRFLSAEQKHRIAGQLIRRQGEPFVLAPRNRPHLYCSTLLATAIQSEYPGFAPQWSQVDTAFFEGEYLFPIAFEHYPGVQPVYRSPSNP